MESMRSAPLGRVFTPPGTQVSPTGPSAHLVITITVAKMNRKQNTFLAIRYGEPFPLEPSPFPSDGRVADP